jgi:hypothetical protein
VSGTSLRRKGSARAAGPYRQQFLVGQVEPTPAGLLAWRALTVPPPSEAEERAMVRVMLQRGLRHEHMDEVRRLGFPLD